MNVDSSPDRLILEECHEKLVFNGDYGIVANLSTVWDFFFIFVILEKICEIAMFKIIYIYVVYIYMKSLFAKTDNFQKSCFLLC